MGESGERELRKTPEGKLRRKRGMRIKIKKGKGEWRGMRGEQFPSGGEHKTQNRHFP